MSYELKKPYTDTQRIDFIVEYNHNLGLRIEETEVALYALEAWEIIQEGIVVDNTEEYNKELEYKEKERIGHLSLTRGDVFRGLLLAKGITKSQIKEMILAMPADTPEEIIAREMALIDFEDALNFYRGNVLIDTLGLQLGITPEQMNKFFETGNYVDLLPIVEPEEPVEPEVEPTEPTPEVTEPEVVEPTDTPEVEPTEEPVEEPSETPSEVESTEPEPTEVEVEPVEPIE